MKLFSFSERMLTMASLCLVVQLSYGQLLNPFSNLNIPAVEGSFFFPQSFNSVMIPDPYGTTEVLTASQCATLFMSMSRASLDSTHVLTDFSGFREHKDSVAHSAGGISIAFLDVNYLDFRSDALTSGMIYRENGNFYHAQGCLESPCLEKESFVLWVDAPHIDSRVYRFLFSQGSWISNYAQPADSMFIDFDDGLGWRNIAEGLEYEVNYSLEARDRVVRSKIYRHGSNVKYAACRLKYSPEYEVCDTVWEQLPNYPPWNSQSNNPWDVQVDYDGEWVKGRAYTLTSNDGEFDKPFLFVEGIDFGLDRDGHPIHDWIRHGTFGWCEFMSGFQDPDASDDIIYGYDDLHLMPELIQAIRAEGYDIVLVDFFDGAGWLEQNSYLVQHVIELCNEFKSGTEPLVVAGASMGGVITRHALRSMETRGEDHCVRLWISMDAPHEGAHIPLSLQHAIRFSAEHGQEQAQLFRDRYLLRPAARQMLDAQVFADLNDHLDWYSQLRELGFPEKCRSIALSNGLSSGVGLNYLNDELMDWECSLSGIEHSKLLLLPESGDAFNENSISGYPVMAHFKLPLVGSEAFGDEWYYWLGGLPLGFIDLVDIEEEIVYTTEGVVNRDYAPGGKRNTTQTFAVAINEGLEQLEDNLFGADLCSDVSPVNYNSDHCFVSSLSSVGISVENPNIPATEHLWQHPEEVYFDHVFFAIDHNENHTELTEHKLDAVLEEVLAPHAGALDTSITIGSANNGVFNFGRPEYPFIRSVHIHEQAQVHINAMMNTHYNQQYDYLSTEFHFEVKTLPCSPEIIRVNNGGVLSIGDGLEEYRTGSLVIGRDSRLIIGSGGVVVVNEGSSLLVEDGGIIEIMPGGQLILRSGTVEVQAGGVCHYRSTSAQSSQHDLILEGNDARLLLNGGVLQLDVAAHVRLDSDAEFSGYIEIAPNTVSSIQLGNGSSLTLEGNSVESLTLRATHGALLNVMGEINAQLELVDGWVDLTDNGAIHCTSHASAHSVLFYASDQWEAEGSELWKWNGSPVFENCRFEHVDLHTVNSKLMLNNCHFQGPNAGVDVREGAYVITATSFDKAICNSSELQAMSAVTDCSFAENSAIVDWSNQELRVTRSSFLTTGISSIEKTTGMLALRCNDFDACGPIVVNYGSLDLSSVNYGGTNSFRSINDCILLNEAHELFLYEGLNDFSGCSHRVFEGTIDTSCVAFDCEFEISANHNHWGYNYNGLSTADGLAFPNPSLVQVQASGTQVCSGYESGNSCQMRIIDQHPIAPVECLQMGKLTTTITETANEHLRDVLYGLTPAAEELSILVFDSQGREVGHEVLATGSLFLAERLGLSPGCYLISAQGLKKFFALRRIVN